MKKDIYIRQEVSADHEAVFALIESAFQDEKHSDHCEQFLVERLRKSSSFIPELSLVALSQNCIVGHILMTKVSIPNPKKQVESLALAPVTVLPSFQKQGIGSQLIQKAHEKAQEMGFESIVLVGHENYYPRFGYQKLSDFEISLPFEVPPQNAMCLELKTNALQDVDGTVIYDKAFFC